MQLTLDIIQTPVPPEAKIWQSLQDQHRQITMERLASLIVKAASDQASPENGHD